MPRTRISTGSPFETSIGYSRALVVGRWVFVAGTTGFDYTTMSLPEGVVEQCRQTLTTIESTLEQAGASLADVVRVRYIVPEPDDFQACWPLLRQAFAEARPAATMISAALLDPAMRIEIEVTARRRTRREERASAIASAPEDQG
ncbi:MAG: RidA family protein, partial [Micropruina sp.]